MRILVTGGTGSVGRAAVARLVEHGHQVKVIGRRAGMDIEGADYDVCDINDFAALRQQVRGMEGIVHLAAIPNPALGPGHAIFSVNCSGTFNVFEAAAQEGIRRVVSASSINAFGYNFGVVPFALAYFPIDEEHPTCTTDPYSFSKQIVEATADYFWRREGITSVSLRLPAVYEVKEHERSMMIAWLEGMRGSYKRLLVLGPEERAARVQGLIARHDQLRAQRLFERPYEDQQELWHDPDMAMMSGRTNFWASVDARDSAQAIEKGLLADYEGSHALFINDSRNFSGMDAIWLIQTFFPEVTTLKGPLVGDAALVSIAKARQLIGFEPEYSPSF